MVYDLLFAASFILLICGGFIGLRHYFSAHSRLEDYYYLLMVMAVVIRYSIELSMLVTKTFTSTQIMVAQVSLTWAYWFYTTFAFNRARIERPKVRKFLKLSYTFTFFILIDWMFASLIKSPYTLVYGSYNPELAILQALPGKFIIANEFARLAMLAFGLAFSHLISRKHTLSSAAPFLCLLFVELLTLLQFTILQTPSEEIFWIIKTLSIVALGLVISDVHTFFKRIAKGQE